MLLSAHDKRIAACVSYYPTIETPPLPGQDEDVVALATRIPCPVHMIRAGKDHLTSEEVFHRLQANLQSRSAPTIVQIYPAGDHGFMQRAGAANEAAIHLSTPQTIAFLKAALRLARCYLRSVGEGWRPLLHGADRLPLALHDGAVARSSIPHHLLAASTISGGIA